MNSRLRSFQAIVTIHFKEFFREPEVIFWGFLFPIILSWVLGIAFSSGGKTTVPVAWTGTAAIGGLGGPAVGLDIRPLDEAQALLALKRGEVGVLARPGAGGRIELSYDPRNASAEVTARRLQAGLAGTDPQPGRVVLESLTLPGTRYIDFLIPGLLAMGLMSSAMWGVGWGLIESRMKKLLRRLAASPLNRTDFLLTFVAARLVQSGLEFLMLILFGRLAFGVRIQGSLAALALIFVTGNLAFSGLAVLIASRTANTRVGNGLINAVQFPMMLLSGVFFSYRHFPEWAQAVVRLLPLTAVADSLRAVINEGAGLSRVVLPAGVLLLSGALFLACGRRIFRWY